MARQRPKLNYSLGRSSKRGWLTVGNPAGVRPA
jgi:hypothetical protein